MNSLSAHVLLIEDNERHIKLLREMLRHDAHAGKFTLSVAPDLASGIEKLGEGKIDAIILDLNLPDSAGMETFTRIQEKAGRTAIVVLSGEQDEALAIRTVQAGAQDYLVKGRVDHHGLARSLQYAMERQQAHAELERRVIARTQELQTANLDLMREVAERQRAEQALRESNHQLAEAMALLREAQERTIREERLHALSQMASGIAHDFNNALAPIQGFSELLLIHPDALADRERVTNYLQMINTAAKESAKIVGRLREFYRFRDQDEALLPVNLNDIIDRVITRTQPIWREQPRSSGREISVRSKLQNVPTVAGVAGQIGEMISQMLMNSVEAIKGHGSITVRTFVRDGSVILQVADTGAGMTEEVRAHCLEPFFSTKDAHGTGLGLGIVYGIVRRHDGDIAIESAVGKGTTVTISLPIYRDVQTPTTGAWTPDTARPIRILVVEDEPLVRELIEVYLLEDKHHVQLAENGREGLEKFRAGTFDLVLTDRKMPEMDGDQLAVEIKAMNPDVPIVMLTGYADIMSGTGERPRGIDQIVSKPFNLAMLREAIAKNCKL